MLDTMGKYTHGKNEDLAFLSYDEFWKAINADLSLRLILLILIQLNIFSKPFKFLHLPGKYFFDPAQVEQSKFLISSIITSVTPKELKNKLPTTWPSRVLLDKKMPSSENDSSGLICQPSDARTKGLTLPLLIRIRLKFSKKFRMGFAKTIAQAIVGKFFLQSLCVKRYVELFFFPKTLEETIAKTMSLYDFSIGWENYELEKELIAAIEKIFEAKGYQLTNIPLSELKNIIDSSCKVYEKIREDAKEWLNIRNLEPILHDELTYLVSNQVSQSLNSSKDTFSKDIFQIIIPILLDLAKEGLKLILNSL